MIRKSPAGWTTRTIVVLEGDETGQELLEESLRVLAPDVIGLELAFPRFDLSLEARRETENGSSTRRRRRSASTGSG